MPSPTEGRKTIEYLLTRGNLEHISGTTAADSAAVIIARAQRRLLTAESGLALGDIEGAFASAYDSYRMAAEALLIRQGLRATGGEGSHVAVEDAISSQFGRQIPGFAKPTFERLRRTRHSVQYFDPSNVDLSADDAEWALSTALGVARAVADLLSNDPPDLFE